MTRPSPERFTVADFGAFHEARAAAGHLLAHGLPPHSLRVIGTELHVVHAVGRRFPVLYALGCLGLVGLGAGLSGNALFVLTEGTALAVGLLLWTAFWSAAAGVALGLLMLRSEHRSSSPRRGQYAPERYELVVDETFAQRARDLL